jgi:hypothetical protein
MLRMTAGDVSGETVYPHQRTVDAPHTLFLLQQHLQAFLDVQPFLRLRLHEQKAVEDPFLPDVTPDGIPIEEATSTDLRRGE